MRFSRLLPLVLCSASCLAARATAPASDPVVWGIMSGNAGCVIFAEGHKTKGMYWGVAVTMKINGKLTVLESKNYTLPKKEYVETQEVMDDLMRIAQKDMVKFVKIPEKYTPDQLDKARTLCSPTA